MARGPHAAGDQFLCSSRGKQSGWAFPCWYHLPVNRPLDPFFDTNITPNDPVFHFVQSIPKDPLFKNWNVKFQFFSCALRILKFCQFLPKNGKFHLNWTQFTPYDPWLFWGFYTKKAQYFGIPHQMTPFFLQNPTPKCPFFRSPLGTTRQFYIWVPPSPWEKKIIWINIIYIMCTFAWVVSAVRGQNHNPFPTRCGKKVAHHWSTISILQIQITGNWQLLFFPGATKPSKNIILTENFNMA